ncbi:MAG: helix-turn-helix transcriptional regulator [Anditalea sp.]
MNDYINIFKAFGKQEYVIYKNDYREELKNNPLVNGLWTVGRWFSFVANSHTRELEFVAGDSKAVIGYSHEEMIKENAQFVANSIFKDDYRFVTQVIHLTMKYVNELPKNQRPYVYVVFYVRSVRKDGKVFTIQNQNIPLVFDEKNIPYVFANIITDISHIYPTNIPHAVIINKFSNQQYHLDLNNLQLAPHRSKFTYRELDVLKLLIRGFTSRKIAEILAISYETARTHRKNILNKANTNNTGQLINYVLLNKVV